METYRPWGAGAACGNPARVDDKVLSATYERQFEAHPDYPELWGVRKVSVRWRLEEGACRALTLGVVQPFAQSSP